jgi:predicted nucleic acid-binding protein
MKPSKPISEWSHILLDTSVIIDYLNDANKIKNNEKVKSRILSVQNFLNNILFKTKVKKYLYVSAITIAELKNMSNKSVFRDLVRLFSASDVVVVSFSKQVAELLNAKMRDGVIGSELQQLNKSLERQLKESNVGMAREWIRDDLKIITTALTLPNLDVVLTSDYKTFTPIAHQLEVPCIDMNNPQFSLNLLGEIDTTA